MRFTMEHTFAVDLPRLERAIFHPDLYPRLVAALDRVEHLEEVERTETEDEIRKRVRVRPRYVVPSFARGKITREMTEYFEVSRYDRRQHRFTYEIQPNIPAAWTDRFTSRGTYRLTEAGGRTRREIEVEVVIRVPLIGGLAEKYIADQVRETFDQEARALERFAIEL